MLSRATWGPAPCTACRETARGFGAQMGGGSLVSEV